MPIVLIPYQETILSTIATIFLTYVIYLIALRIRACRFRLLFYLEAFAVLMLLWVVLTIVAKYIPEEVGIFVYKFAFCCNLYGWVHIISLSIRSTKYEVHPFFTSIISFIMGFAFYIIFLEPSEEYFTSFQFSTEIVYGPVGFLYFYGTFVIALTAITVLISAILIYNKAPSNLKYKARSLIFLGLITALNVILLIALMNIQYNFPGVNKLFISIAAVIFTKLLITDPLLTIIRPTGIMYIIVAKKEGIPIYSHHFVESVEYPDAIFSGIVSAVYNILRNSFGHVAREIEIVGAGNSIYMMREKDLFFVIVAKKIPHILKRILAIFSKRFLKITAENINKIEYVKRIGDNIICEVFGKVISPKNQKQLS